MQRPSPGIVGPVIPDLFDRRCAPFRLDGDRNEAVVLIHGFTGAPTHFRPLAEFLHGHGYTVSAPLLAGHGTTMEHMQSTGWRDWLRSARHAADAVSDHGRVHLVGLSMGGLLAIVVASKTAAATVTTINTPILVRDPKLYLAPFVHRLRPLVTWPEDNDLPVDADVAQYWLTYPGFYTSNATDLLRLVTKAVVVSGRIRRPGLIIQSRADESVHPLSARILARRLGHNATVVYLDRSFHNALFSDEREIVHHAVLDRLR